MALFIGLMSGTSLDGVDGVLAESPSLALRSHAHRPFDASLQTDLLALNERGGQDELHRAALAAIGVARACAAVVGDLLAQAGVAPGDVRAIGAHGQTVRHRPGGPDGYTLQLLDGARLAEATGIDVICDLRSRDVAAGGQGAPLVPAFHAARFARAGVDVAVLNIGGIANLSLLGADGSVRGFDTGPGNVLMDLWARRHLGRPYDAGGQWAASAEADPALLADLLAHPFLSLPPPKSTGRDDFHAAWLDRVLAPYARVPPASVQASLMALTARSIATALRGSAPGARVLRVAGGGARNDALLAALARLLDGVDVRPTDADGVAAEHVEALAFAWLAQAFVDGRAGNLPAVTGAAGPRRLGALYPAR